MTSDTDNDYWNGRTHAVLTRDDVLASWGRGEHSSTRIDAANRAFCIWYWGQQTLSDSATEPHWSDMYQSMRACANEGWGWGVSDLRESLWHISQNGGIWSDTNTKTYFGGRGKSYARSIISDMAEGPANFLSAVDDKLPRLKETMQTYQEKCAAISRLNIAASTNTSDWDQMRENLSSIKTYAERAKSLMWMLPAAVSARVPSTSGTTSALRRVEEFADGATTWLNRSVKILDIVGKITDGITVYTEASRALGGDRRAGVAFAALHYAMNFVPILGSFYGTIISKIPGLINNWRAFIADYRRRFDDPEGWLRSRENRPSAWRCSICGSTGGY